MDDSKQSSGSDLEVEIRPPMESQEFLTEFINIYHAYSCLWKYSSRDYRNQEVKKLAYEALAKKMREIDPHADTSSVGRKINALRTAFRREYKKVRKAASGNSSKYPNRKYTPTLWYYDLLKFVVDEQDFTDPGPGTMITEWPQEESQTMLSEQSLTYQANVGEEYGNVGDHNADTFMEYDNAQTVKIEPTSPASSRPTTPQSVFVDASSTSTLGIEINAVYSEKNGSTPTSNDEKTASSRAKRSLEEQQQTTISSSENLTNATASFRTGSLKRPYAHQTSFEPKDVGRSFHLEHFGQYVVAKLKKSSMQQCVIAEKIIAEVLMRSNLGTLSEFTVLSDIPKPENQSI